jgi:hypothetical protein
MDEGDEPPSADDQIQINTSSHKGAVSIDDKEIYKMIDFEQLFTKQTGFNLGDPFT